MMEKMLVRPITLREANAFVMAHHRHRGRVAGCRFCVSLAMDGTVIGVAIVGRPCARALDDGVTAEVVRCCVLDPVPMGACSKLYAACRRAWFAMGGTRMVTYTLASEAGTSLKGAGWTPVADVKPGSWDRASRPRQADPVYGEPKIRWEAVR